MTWTVRLYDSDGVEIGWAKMGDDKTYSYGITHPDTGWDRHERVLRSSEELYPASGEGDQFGIDRGPDFSLIVDPAPMDLLPEDHIRRVEDNVKDLPGVDSTAVADE